MEVLWQPLACFDPVIVKLFAYRSSFASKVKKSKSSAGGDEIVLREKRGAMARAFDLLAALPEDVDVPGDKRDTPQKRKGL